MKFLVKSILFILINTLLCVNVYAQTLSREQYINKYKELAVTQMNQYGIPASIIMAQACIESGNGNSRLAVKGNNHFGIKCGGNWNGKQIYHNDDKRNECFRKYNTVEDSFKDHSEFLKNGRRYSSLFNLERTDYKAWAYGLKAAGYATDPRYAKLLIDIIEKYKLYELDMPADPIPATGSTPLTKSQLYKYSLDRQIYICNGVPYIIATGTESFTSLSKEYNLLKKELLKFNDLKKEQTITAGTIIYIAKKKDKGDVSTYVVQENDTMHSISQKFGIRLQKLYKLNNMKYGTEAESGKILSLQ